MAVAFAHYIGFVDKSGLEIPGRKYQNFFVGESRTYQSISYQFAPFAVVGISSSRNGDVGEGSLVSVPNEITVSLFSEAILSRWIIDIKTIAISMNEFQQFTESSTIASEVWACIGGSNENDRITITLSSPINAAMKEIPGRVLTRSMVGAIPPTGQIAIS